MDTNLVVEVGLCSLSLERDLVSIVGKPKYCVKSEMEDCYFLNILLFTRSSYYNVTTRLVELVGLG